MGGFWGELFDYNKTSSKQTHAHTLSPALEDAINFAKYQILIVLYYFILVNGVFITLCFSCCVFVSRKSVSISTVYKYIYIYMHVYVHISKHLVRQIISYRKCESTSQCSGVGPPLAPLFKVCKLVTVCMCVRVCFRLSSNQPRSQQEKLRKGWELSIHINRHLLLKYKKKIHDYGHFSTIIQSSQPSSNSLRFVV